MSDCGCYFCSGWADAIAKEVAQGELGWYMVGVIETGRGVFLQAFGPRDAIYQAHLRRDLDFKARAEIGVARWTAPLPPPSLMNRRLERDELVELAQAGEAVKRSGPIERRTPLRAKSWGVKPDPVGQRRRRARDRGEYADPQFLALVRQMTCCCAVFDGASCWGPIDPHHAGEGLACPDPERRKTCDRTAIPICRGHHRAIECFEGIFKLTWNETRRRQFYDVEIAKTQAEVARLRAA